MERNSLTETLYNCHEDCVIDRHHPDQNKIDYGRGVLVGVVGCLMAEGYKFEDAIKEVLLTRQKISDLVIPNPWKETFERIKKESGL